jgi:O-antigen ligase
MWALTATGLVGTIPMLWAVLALIAKAWRARRGAHGVMPFILLVIVLTMSLSLTVHKRKITWLVFAYVAGSAAVAPGARTGRALQPAPNRSPNRRRYGTGPAG